MKITLLMLLLLQNKQTAFHLATKGGHLHCLQLLFAAVECRGLLESLPSLDKVNSITCVCVVHESCLIE